MARNIDFHSIAGRIQLTVFCVATAIVLGIAAWATNTVATPEAVYPQVGKVDLLPVRGEFKPLRLRRSGFQYKCSECHRLFESPLKQETRVAEHTDLILTHGRNNYCFNCHHRANRDVYTDYDGSEIPASEPARLCAKCHGTTYRDWLVGLHGKIAGSWKSIPREGTHILCIQCHDPHSPKFPALKPLPGPVRGRPHATGGEQ